MNNKPKFSNEAGPPASISRNPPALTIHLAWSEARLVSPKISEKTRPEARQRRVGRILTFSGPIFATEAHEAAAQGVRVLV